METTIETINEDDLDEDKCLYKFKKNKQIDPEDIFFEATEENITTETTQEEERISKPVLFKFERVRILGIRAKQLQMGAKPLIKNVEGLNPKEIAKLELKEKVIPFIVERSLPNGKKEKFKISELKLIG